MRPSRVPAGDRTVPRDRDIAAGSHRPRGPFRRAGPVAVGAVPPPRRPVPSCQLVPFCWVVPFVRAASPGGAAPGAWAGPPRAAACACACAGRSGPGRAWPGWPILAGGNLAGGSLARGILRSGHLVCGGLPGCGLLGRGVPRGVAAVGRDDADLGLVGGGSGEGA